MSAKNWELNYVVTADFVPFRYWNVKAESEIEARQKISELTNIPIEELSASPAPKEAQP